MISTNLSPSTILESGDRLSREDFEHRYAASNVKKAELIEGVVYVVSPLRFTSHGKPHILMSTWLNIYQMNSPGLEIGIEPTVRLDPDNEVQPDVVLFRSDSSVSCSVNIDLDGYLTGSPDLIVEIAASSASYDLHTKKDVYERNGVREYIVWRTLDQQIDGFVLENGVYQKLDQEEGILYSTQFAGLCLDVGAMLNGDLAQVLRVLHESHRNG